MRPLMFKAHERDYSFRSPRAILVGILEFLWRLEIRPVPVRCASIQQQNFPEIF